MEAEKKKKKVKEDSESSNEGVKKQLKVNWPIFFKKLISSFKYHQFFICRQ